MTDILTLEAARSRVAECTAELSPPGIERCELGAARGRRLAAALRAPGPWPTTDRSAMDGFGIASAGQGAAIAAYPVVGAALAGHPFSGGPVDPGRAIRIMTGAVVPAGIDTVVRVEDTDGYEGDTVRVQTEVAAGANIRRQGSEIAAGTALLEAGVRLRAPEIGALAVLGRDQVDVYERPVVALLSTGDEVVPLDTDPAPHQVRDSNRWALAAQIEEYGGVALPLGIAADDETDLRARLERGLREADLLITIGGVSKGTHDLVHGTLAALGVEPVFHGIALKPGKPTFFGRGPAAQRARFVFGLPGNPASCFSVFELLVAPVVARLGGGGASSADATFATRGGAPFRKNWRTQAIPAALATSSSGALEADLLEVRPSGDPFSLLGADALALVPGDATPDEVPAVRIATYGSGWRAAR